MISANSSDYEEEIAYASIRETKRSAYDLLFEHENIQPVFEVNSLSYVTMFIAPKMSKNVETTKEEDDI